MLNTEGYSKNNRKKKGKEENISINAQTMSNGFHLKDMRRRRRVFSNSGSCLMLL